MNALCDGRTVPGGIHKKQSWPTVAGEYSGGPESVDYYSWASPPRPVRYKRLSNNLTQVLEVSTLQA